MPEFRYPNVTPILHDPEISNGVFKQLKDLFIETISRPVSISNVNFSHEMKNTVLDFIFKFIIERIQIMPKTR